MKNKLRSSFCIRHSSFAHLATLLLLMMPPRAPAQTNWGNALSFDGLDDYVSFGVAPLPVPWTAEFWVNRQDSPDITAVLLNDNQTVLKLEQTATARRVGFTQFEVGDYTFGYTAPAGTWVHLAFVSDTTTRLYVNGVLQDTIAKTISLPMKQLGAVKDKNNNNVRLKGSMDEVRIWNVARSASDIQANMAHPLTGTEAGLVACYRFDEGTGTTAHDATTNHCNGTLVNAPTWVASRVPKWGYALSFTPSALVVVVDDDRLDLTVNYTLECWFKANSFGSLRGLVSKYYNTGANGYLLRLTGTDLDFDLKTTSGLNLQTGVWYHVAAVNSNGTRRLYLNGEEQTLNGTAITVQANSDDLALGSDFHKADRYFQGQMDEVRIWNVARSQTQIRAEMMGPLTGREAGLVACYHFDEASDITAYDATSNHLDGMLIGGSAWLASTVPPVPYTYTTNNGAISITGYSGFGGDVTIPWAINGLPVTSIGNWAFYQRSSLHGVTIPDSVTSIGKYAFEYCDLTSVTIGNSVTSIGQEAFCYCYSLTNITIGNSVTSIGIDAFRLCTSLNSVTIPNSVVSIGDEAFDTCSSLTGVYFQGNPPGLGSSPFYGSDNVTVYYLPGTTNWTAIFAGRPAVLWNARAQTCDASFGVRTNRFGFTVTGTTNIPIVVETCTNLAGATWTPRQTCCVTNGSIYFCDPQWTNHPTRFYRLRWP